jgi:hypothetical protein
LPSATKGEEPMDRIADRELPEGLRREWDRAEARVLRKIVAGSPVDVFKSWVEIGQLVKKGLVEVRTSGNGQLEVVGPTPAGRLTPKERKMLHAIAESEYRDGNDLDVPVWSWDLGGRGAGGVIASLLKKGLIGQAGKGNPLDGDGATVWLTEAGIAALPADVRAKHGRAA